MSNLSTRQVERLAVACGMRALQPQPRRNVKWDVGGILSADTLETIHDWEDVDGDYLRKACLSGETLGVDE